MRIEVELERDVTFFLRHKANDAEVTAFQEALRRVTTDPVALIENSEPEHRPDRRYIFRFFRFSRYAALFQMNRARDRIRVLECIRILPRQKRGQSHGSNP